MSLPVVDWLNRFGILFTITSFFFLTPQLVGQKELIKLERYVQKQLPKLEGITGRVFQFRENSYKLPKQTKNIISLIALVVSTLLVINASKKNLEPVTLIGGLSVILILFFIIRGLLLEMVYSPPLALVSPIVYPLSLLISSLLEVDNSVIRAIIFAVLLLVGLIIVALNGDKLVALISRFITAVLQKMDNQEKITERWATIGIGFFFLGSILQFIATF